MVYILDAHKSRQIALAVYAWKYYFGLSIPAYGNYRSSFVRKLVYIFANIIINWT